MADIVPALSIPQDKKFCYVVMKAREFDAKDMPTVSDDGSNPTESNDAGFGRGRGPHPVIGHRQQIFQRPEGAVNGSIIHRLWTT